MKQTNNIGFLSDLGRTNHLTSEKFTVMQKQFQHFVPETYLNGFSTNGKGSFYELGFKYMHIRSRRARNVCSADNLYEIDESTLNRFNISDPKYIEKNFSYERTYAKILKLISAREMSISLENYRTIIDGYISMKHRNPYFREEFGNRSVTEYSTRYAAFEVYQKYLPLIKAIGMDFEKVVYEIIEKVCNDKDTQRQFHNDGIVQAMKNLNDAVNEAQNLLLSMSVGVLPANDGDYFLISDNPDFSLVGTSAFNTFFSRSDSIVFPINSKQALIFTGQGTRKHGVNQIPLKYLARNDDAVFQANIAAVQFASNFVYCENREYLERFKETNFQKIVDVRNYNRSLRGL